MNEIEILSPIKPIRDASGKLLPGGPGLPGAGRPRGMTNADKIRLLLEPERDKLVGRMLKLAEDPDGHVSVRAVEMALSRLAPAPKADSERIEIPGLAEAVGFTAKCDCVILAVSNGQISVEAGERVLRLLEIYRRAHETDELTKKVDALIRGTSKTIIDTQPDGYDLI